MNYKITIDPKGKIAVETSNMAGPRCTELSEAIRAALGAKLDSLQPTEEYFLPDPETLIDESESEHQTL